MKQAEKLKRIKLISEELFVKYFIMVSEDDDSRLEFFNKPTESARDISNYSILLAKEFVNEFEKFENEFLKEHEVKCDNDRN